MTAAVLHHPRHATRTHIPATVEVFVALLSLACLVLHVPLDRIAVAAVTVGHVIAVVVIVVGTVAGVVLLGVTP